MSDVLSSTQRLLDEAATVYQADPESRFRIEALRKQAAEPLRVVLVGSVKAGKSTLLNALLGEQLAPTDARECTRIVTWYRYGRTPSIKALHSTNGEIRLPTRRQDDRLELELDGLDADQVEALDITWPAAPLEEFTLVDTPGMASISTEVGLRTTEFMTHSVAEPDAVIYLLRSLHEHDVDFLRTLNERQGSDAGIGALAVLSRADELGAGRLNAMAVANKAVDRLRDDPSLEAACETIVPVAGLLALAGQTLRQSEFASLAKIAALPGERLAALMVSADRFLSVEGDDLPSPRVRSQLMQRLSLFGVRLAIAMIQVGASDATTLADELVRHSGLDELKRVIDVHCRRRHPQLKAHTVLVGLQQLMLDHPRAEARRLGETVDELLSDPHPFHEMKLLGRVNSARIRLGIDDRREMERLLGGDGTSAADRLGTDQDMDARALAALWKWRDLAVNPLVDAETAEACRITARSCEGILATTGWSVAS